MIKNNELGYLFDAKPDCETHVGLINTIKVSQTGAIRKIHLTLGVDTSGKITPPVYNDYSLGFAAITNENLNNLVKGNKSFFSIVGEFALVLSGTVTIDLEAETINTEKLHFYVPKDVIASYEDRKNANGEVIPYIVCDRLGSNLGELNSFYVQHDLIEAYLKQALTDITIKTTENKLEFFKHILDRES